MASERWPILVTRRLPQPAMDRLAEKADITLHEGDNAMPRDELLKGISGKGAPYVVGFGTPRHIGTLLLTKYLFPFEIASIVLMVAAIGAVVLARRRRGLETMGGDEPREFRISAHPPVYTGTMAEAAGVRVPTPEEIEPEVEVVGRSAEERGW